MSSPTSNRRGILAMLAAMALFTTNDTLLKVAAGSLPPGQIMAVRGVFAAAFAFGLILAFGRGRHLGGVASPVVLMRAALEALVAFLYITSLAFLPLANITAILLATPILMTLMTVALGIERVRWRRWTAIVVGFVGVLLIVKPSPEAFDRYAGIALASAIFVAIRDLATRSIRSDVPSLVVTLATTSGVALAGLVIGFWETWQPVAGQLGLLAAAAIIVTFGNLCVIVAFRYADVSVVSPFRYSIVVLAIVMGYVVFDEWPDRLSGLGIALIVGAGLYTIHREHVTRRDAARPIGAP